MAFADPGKDRQIIDSGVGRYPPTVTLAVACKRGDVLGYSSGWKPALATVSSVVQGRVVALSDGAIGDVIAVSPRALVGGYTGATPGNPVYVAEGTSNGQITETIPATTNDATTVVGLVLSATEVLFNLGARADSLSS